MRRLLSIAIVTASLGVLLARGDAQAPAPAAAEGEPKIIDFKADVVAPVSAGDSVIYLVRNFAAQHNGAVITCDSAVRYSDMRMDFFGNVLINKNTTYIYGDRAEYDGEQNIARVYSDLVKVVDGDATLYTYTFLFDTKANIGLFDDGGVLINRDNLLEAVRGYYYADTKELVAVDKVEMRNEEYELAGDSVVYNMATDNAYFFERTNIWNRDGDYLYADRGEYHKADTLYVVTRNGYVLTDKQEMWSDSIDFYRMRNHVILRRDVQIDDTEHKALVFGDYGEYWKEPGNALLTRDPAIISYDRTQGDSLFMRSDTIWLYTINEQEEARRAAAAARADSLARALAKDSAALTAPAPGPREQHRRERMAADSTAHRPGSDSLALRTTPGLLPDSAALAADSLAQPADSLSLAASGGVDSLSLSAADSLARVRALDTLTKAERKALLKEQARREKAERKAAEAKARKEKLDQIAAERREKTTAKLLEQKAKEEARLAARRLKAESKLRARQARAARRGKPFKVDSTELWKLDALAERNAAEQDSLYRLLMQEWATDSVALLAPVADTTDSVAAVPRDSIYRLVKGYRNVRAYRSDFQNVCDSMVMISTDSTIHLYIEPVLWNQSNQVTSEVMDIYTANQQITRAEFVGSPMMVAQLDTLHYNQVAGKEMISYFHNNEIFRNDVNGNAQTIYYMQDGEPPEIVNLGVIESGDCTFYIEDKQVVTIVYRSNPVWHLYSINDIPADQELYLKGFRWEGARRPSQQDVFDGVIRPSERAARSALPHPRFPIMQRIEENKRRLIEQRRWSDRMDQVDAETVEWMHDLGYEVGQPRESGNKSF